MLIEGAEWRGPYSVKKDSDNASIDEDVYYKELYIGTDKPVTVFGAAYMRNGTLSMEKSPTLYITPRSKDELLNLMAEDKKHYTIFHLS